MRRSGGYGTGAAIALAGLALTLAGCSHVLPLGPAPAAAPAPRQLASAIVMEPGLRQPGTPASGCPAGSVELFGPDVLAAAAGGFGSPSTSASTSGKAGMCYRLRGQPVTFTSAGVALLQQPAGHAPAGHAPAGYPAAWNVSINLSAAEAAKLTTITTNAFHSRSQIAIIVAGKTWFVPVTLQPLTHGEFSIAVQSRNQGLQLQRALLDRSA